MNPVRSKKSGNSAKVLIGTPIHVSKDYSMERWLANVARLQEQYPSDLLLVDNSEGLGYVKKVKAYCQKFGVKNYRIEHLKIPQGKAINKSIDEQIHERIVRSEEIIRQDFLASNYDIWFFWESDILIPPGSLDKMIKLLEAGDAMVVIHNCWINDVPNQMNFHFGITLFRREFIKKYSFIPDFKAADAPPSWYEAENWFRNRIRKDGCNFIEVAGLIEPVNHLGK